MTSTQYRRFDASKRSGLPVGDGYFTDVHADFVSLFSAFEREREPWLDEYAGEVLARWGRWAMRGRPPHLCFEAATVAGLGFLELSGVQPSERTERIERALAMAIAGSTVDALEPNASEAMREKAVLMLADEYLGKSATPNLASDARKRAQNRRSRTLVRRPGDPAPSQSKIPSTPFSHPQQQPLRQQPSQSQPFYPQHNQPIYRKSPGPVNSASPIPPLNATNSPRFRSLSRETPKRTNSSQKQRRPSAGGDPSTSLSTDRRNSISSLNEDSILQPQPQNPPLSPAPSSSSYNPRQFEVVSPAPYISRSTSNSGNSSQHQKGGPNSTPPQFRRKKSFEGGGIDYIDDSTQPDMNRSEVGVGRSEVGRSEVGRSNSLKALHQQQLQQQQLQQQQQQQQNSPQRHAMPIQMQQQIQNRYRELGSGGPGDRGSPSFGYLQQQQRSGYRSDEQGQGQGQGTQRGQSLSRNSSRK